MHPLLRKLLSPAGFLFVTLCFLLPFATVSCSTLETGRTWATYAGVDLVARRAASDVHISDEVRDLNDPTISDTQDTIQNESGAGGPVSAQPLMSRRWWSPWRASSSAGCGGRGRGRSRPPPQL